MSNFSIQELFCTDLSRIFVLNEQENRPAEKYDLRKTAPNDLYYVSPFLCVGSDGGFSETEISNVRTFRKKFIYSSDWVYETGGINEEMVGVRLNCTDERIIDVLHNFKDNPVLDSRDCHQLLVEKEWQAWNKFLRKLFLARISKKFNVQFQYVPGKKLFDLYDFLQALSNAKGHLQKGKFYIDLNLLVDQLPELPAFLRATIISR